MPRALRKLLIQIFQVSEEPNPPAGKNLKTFRASPNYFKYSMLTWGFQLLFTCLFIVVTLVSMAGDSESSAADYWLWIIGLLMAAFAAVPLLIRLLTLRLDYEFRWYMVTDSGLRIREGIAQVHEITMAFKNIQNITISQGPIQRLLGISDLVVQTAGGSSGAAQGNQGQGVVSSHTGYFRGVDNAEEIRDMMMARLREAKQDSKPAAVRPTRGESKRSALSRPALAALREAAGEASLLRAGLEADGV